MNSKQLIKIWSRVLVEACEGKNLAEQKKIIARLGTILKAKKKEHLLAQIVKNAFEIIEAETKLEITLAHPQSAEFIDKLKKKIAGKFEGNGAVEVAVSPSIIGGFKVKSSQYILDASVKSYLEQLRKNYEN